MTQLDVRSRMPALWCLAALLMSSGVMTPQAVAGRMSLTLAAVPDQIRPAEVVAQAQPAPARPAVTPAVVATPVRGHQALAPYQDARFDIAVNEAPAAQVFLQLGMTGQYNMLVSPEVTGTITLKLRQTTVPEALEALRELYGYDFRIKGNRVFVYPNTVQTRLFRISYLPGRRQGASDLRVNSNFSLQAAGASNSGAASASAAGGSTGNYTAAVPMTTDTRRIPSRVAEVFKLKPASLV